MNQAKLLAQANHAMRQHDYPKAIRLYAEVLVRHPALGRFLQANLHYAAKAYRADRMQVEKPTVGVCSWSLGHNPAGRAYALATIYQGMADVEIVGSLLPKFGTDIWPPLQNCPLPVHSFVIQDESEFLQQAILFVAKHPYDLVHLSKPRAPNIFFGMLYKILWGATVIMDVDDEELAFVQADTPLSLDAYLEQHGSLPKMHDLSGNLWTRLAVGLVNQFDGVTVCNKALQKRYGGSIIRHARSPELFSPSAERRSQARAKLGIGLDKTVIIFAGTPRAHKGLEETAEAIVQQQCDDLVFMIVGSFPKRLEGLQQKIASMPGLETLMLPDQDFYQLPDILAAGDISVMLQDPDSLAARYQTPAKLTDALAMGLTVLATSTPGLADLGTRGAFIPVPPGQLSQVLRDTLTQRRQQHLSAPEPHPLFMPVLSTRANQAVLQWLWKEKTSNPQSMQPGLQAMAKQSLELSAAITAAEKIVIAVHLYYVELWEEIADHLKKISYPFMLDITTTPQQEEKVTALVTRDFPAARIHPVKNQGMDILPFLSLVPKWQAEGVIAVCKLHTKKGNNDSISRHWRSHQLEMLAGSPENIPTIIQAFKTNPQLSLVGSSVLFLSGQTLLYDNSEALEQISQSVSQQSLPEADWGFFAGTMFWARPADLLPLAQCAMTSEAAFAKTYAKDGQYEHALERAFGLIAYQHKREVGLLYPMPTTSTGNASEPALQIIKATEAGSKQYINPVHASQAVRQTYSLIDWSVMAKKPRQPGLVSIIIPIYNQPELTAACIDSIYRHTQPGIFELILVDNASNIETRHLLDKLAGEHSNIQLHRNSQNLNFAEGCNQGFAISQGETVLFLNNDTTVTHGWLAPIVEALQRPDIGAVQPKLLYPDGSIQCIGVVFSDKSVLGYPIYAGMPPSPWAEKSRRLQAVTGAAMALRAKDFSRLHGFDPLYINGQEDIDLCLRLNQYYGQASAWVATESTVIHHESKTQNRFQHVNQNRRNFVQRWQGHVQTDDMIYYAQDGYRPTGYAADSNKRAPELKIWRPVL